jgi:hypothetical protein
MKSVLVLAVAIVPFVFAAPVASKWNPSAPAGVLLGILIF